MSIRIRRARADDVDFLVELANDEDVEPFLAARRARDRDAVAQEVERSLAEPQEFGRFVIEVDDGDGWLLAGSPACRALSVSRLTLASTPIERSESRV